MMTYCSLLHKSIFFLSKKYRIGIGNTVPNSLYVFGIRSIPNFAVSPWPPGVISKEIKECIVLKKVAFRRGGLVAMKDAQKESNYKLRKARRQERETFETHCLTMNSRK